jgi:hypothetical protein
MAGPRDLRIQMSNATTVPARMARLARRISSSSGARVPQAHFAPCVLDLLGQTRPQADTAAASLI